MPSSPPETHVRFVPFELIDRRDKVLLGRDRGRAWLVLEPPAARIVSALDAGTPVEAVEGAAEVVTALSASGFVEHVGARHGGSARVRSERAPRSPWPWRAFAIGTVAAFIVSVWGFAGERVVVHDGAALLLSGLPLAGALGVLIAALMVTGAIHELAHVVAGRHFGLRPSVKVGLRVARTRLDGVWALERSLRWRPIAAGLMVDTWVLAAAVLARSPMLAATVLCRALWQLQCFLRTDVHFLYAALTGALNLRETSRLLLRRSVRGRPPSEVRAARGYLLAVLPAACAATLALWLWMLLPLAEAVLA